MALPFETFRHDGARHHGVTLFKALGHPFAAKRARRLVERLRGAGPVAVVDPDGAAESFDAFYALRVCEICGIYVQNVMDVGRRVLGHAARPLEELASARAGTVFLARFDATRLRQQIAPIVPDAPVAGFDDVRIPESWLANPRRYLDPLNFATNFALFRDGGGHRTVLRTANYWGAYGAEDPQLWLCLFDADGGVLAEWTEPLPPPLGAVTIDSRDIRRRFGLGDYAGSLFLHVLRARGHDVVKYALDTADEAGGVQSATHDANAWPADWYAGLPAPADGERVLLWVQNSHPAPIPADAIALNVMGEDRGAARYGAEVPPFATRALDTEELLPGVRWPAQIEVHAGRHFVRPRYEVVADGRRWIAHANVERTDLVPDPELPRLGDRVGRGFLLPFPVLPRDRYATELLPTPMARSQSELPVAVRVYAPDGREVARERLGHLPRGHRRSCPIDGLIDGRLDGYGHVELMYDFADGGEADGWLHAIARFRDRRTGHAADTSFGAHVYNILAVYRDEPQSYAGPPPGLSTRLFLRVGPDSAETLCHLIYPASKPWVPRSDTTLALIGADGKEVAREAAAIPCGGSLLWRVDEAFDTGARARAGAGAYVTVRDASCRLFGFHGLRTRDAFSFDHMFGF